MAKVISKNTREEKVEDRAYFRKIPATMVSQHPDNSMQPYWHKSAFVTTADETHEAYLSFSELGVSEYKWDWEGKLVDESVMERLLSNHYEFFKDNPLGVEKFLTFRLPNIQVETEFRLGRAFMNLISAAAMARQFKLSDTPLFEVILPMTVSAKDMISIHEAFGEMANLKHELYRMDKVPLKTIKVIPLFEDIDTIVNSHQILKEYLESYQKLFKKKPVYLRPYVARSDPALNSGMIPTVLAIKIALSHYVEFEEETGVRMHPIIGSASLPFRGGLSPDTVDQFANEYRGVATALLQSAFRYDYPKEKVIRAIKKLESLLPRGRAAKVSADEEKVLLEIMKIFEGFYKPTIEGIADVINKIAENLPKRRERVQHIGLFGYSRGVGKVRLPRAIGFTAALYSLGVPPELIGAGRGLKALSSHSREGGNPIKNETHRSRIMSGMTHVALLEKYYLNLSLDLERAGRYLNKKVLRLLAKKNKSWKGIEEDILEIEKYLGEELKPKTEDEIKHQELSSKIYSNLTKGKDIKNLVEQAALLRKSLG